MAMSLGRRTLSTSTRSAGRVTRCSGGSVSAPQGAAKYAGVASDLRPQQKSEQRDGQPWLEVRADPHDQPRIVKLEHHRVGDRDAGNARIAHRYSRRALADDLAPDKVGQPP